MSDNRKAAEYRDVLKGVFESLGRERFLEKTESMRLLRTRLDFEQLLYEGIMEALGYERNSKALRELAQHVPFADLRSKIGVRNPSDALRRCRTAAITT